MPAGKRRSSILEIVSVKERSRTRRRSEAVESQSQCVTPSFDLVNHSQSLAIDEMAALGLSYNGIVAINYEGFQSLSYQGPPTASLALVVLSAP